jgi:hypothetical protein
LNALAPVPTFKENPATGFIRQGSISALAAEARSAR